MNWDELVADMDKKLRLTGVVNAWTMPIKNRIDMLSTGIRTPVGFKILGPDLVKIEEIGKNIEANLQMIRGTRSVSVVLKTTGAIGQEQKHEGYTEELKASAKNTAEPAKSSFMKCCEEMEKRGEMKVGMPMNSDAKSEMKPKMEKMQSMKGMKEKMAEKMKAMGAPDASQKAETIYEIEKSSEINMHKH